MGKEAQSIKTQLGHTYPVRGDVDPPKGLPPLASAVVGAGTHTATLECEALGGATPAMTVADDALAAWAVAG